MGRVRKAKTALGKVRRRKADTGGTPVSDADKVLATLSYGIESKYGG